jgi:dethiobiotin synthetase
MGSAPDGQPPRALRVAVVGTGTGVGKTHVACAVLAAWAPHRRVVGLKPIETGVSASASALDREFADRARAKKSAFGGPLVVGVARPDVSDASRPHETRARAHPAPHGVLADARVSGRRERGPHGRRGAAEARSQPGSWIVAAEASDQARLAQAASLFHVKRRRGTNQMFHVEHRPLTKPNASDPSPLHALYAFPDPVSPHLAARLSCVRIDLGEIERWVRAHEASVTLIETAGGLFSPLGHGTTNFDLLQVLRPDAVLLVASDRLGVLHELTATLGFVAARGGPELGVVLSTPAVADASTGRNAAEIDALGIARPIAVFARADERARATLEAARQVIAWIERGTDRRTSEPVL